ncbi:baseplate J/gp47 family protein [Candidatus Pacearchaeota archaeon]|nr:baseplate J/gp47 family protein [Candidatus Pacearchaeota archaeon]
MPVEIKSLTTNTSTIKTDIESKTNQNTPAVPVSYNNAISAAVAGMALTGQLHNIDQRKETNPATASEEVGLPLWAELTNRYRAPGDRAELQVLVTGEDGSAIGTGSTGPVYQGPNGRLYDVKTGGTIGSVTPGQLSIEIIDRQSGEDGTLQTDTIVKLTETIPGVDQDATVTAINVEGSEQESVESWRSAIIHIVAFPPNIGTSAWFYEESLKVPGITRIYPYVDEDFPGRVIIYAVDDSKVDGQPSASQLTAIEDIYKVAGFDVMWATGTLPNLEKRIEALVSPIELYYVTITEGAPALSETMKAAIETSINEYFKTRNPYINGLSLSDVGVVEKAAILTTAQNTIDAEVGDTGRIDDLTLQKDGEPAANLYTLPIGTRAKVQYIYT